MRELILSARENEEKRFMLVRSFEPIIKKCIKIYVRNPEDFEDALQQGRQVVIECIKNYNVDAVYPFPAYVKRAVIYSIRDFSKKIKDNLSLDCETENGGSLHDVLESDVNIEVDSERAEDLKRLREALCALSDKQRQVIDDFFIKGLSMRDICKNRRCHYMAVVKLKERALGRLREIMME